MVQALGLALIVGFLTKDIDINAIKNQKENNANMELQAQVFLASILRPIFVLIIGFIISLFL
jgi:hypothetical protein